MHHNYNRYSYVLNNPLKYTDPTGQRYALYSDNKVDNEPIYSFESSWSSGGGGGFSYNFKGSYSMYVSNPEMYAFTYGTQTWMQTATANAALIYFIQNAYSVLNNSGTWYHKRGKDNIGSAGEQQKRDIGYTWTFNNGNTNYTNKWDSWNSYYNATAQVGGGGGTQNVGVNKLWDKIINTSIVVADYTIMLPIDFTGAVYDFSRNYFDMRNANFKNSDKYFHAKANFQATHRGPGGEFFAEHFSNLREIWDQNVKGYPRSDSKLDQKANLFGRTQTRFYAPNYFKDALKIYRPSLLPSKY